MTKLALNHKGIIKVTVQFYYFFQKGVLQRKIKSANFKADIINIRYFGFYYHRNNVFENNKYLSLNAFQRYCTHFNRFSIHCNSFQEFHLVCIIFVSNPIKSNSIPMHMHDIIKEYLHWRINGLIHLVQVSKRYRSMKRGQSNCKM